MNALLPLALMLASTAVLGAPANFSGEWDIDIARSDAVTPMLERCGVGLLERKAAAAFEPTVTIRHRDGRLEIQQETLVTEIDTVAILDGKPRVVQTPLGPMRVQATAVERGAAIRSETVTDCKRNGVKMEIVTTRRFLKSTNEMLLHMDVALGDEKRVQIRRIYIRKSRPPVGG